MPVDPHRQISSRAFLGGLLVVLMLGLVWALTPSQDPSPSTRRFSNARPRLSQAAPPSPSPSPLPTPATARQASPATETTALLAALIAAAGPPESTTLQVLDAGGGRERRQAAISALEALGYQVISTASARQDVTQTTIWFTNGNEMKAQALQARDPRFASIAPSAGLSARVDLHILVGPDWE